MIKNEPKRFEFMDQTVPAYLFYLMIEKEITKDDLLLICIINTLTVHIGGDKSPTGCYASNGYLARTIKTNPMYVSRRIQVLNKKGLLLIVNIEGQRYLEMVGKRIPEEIKQIEGKYGEGYRKAYNEIIKRGGKLKGLPIHNRKGLPPLTEKVDQSILYTTNSSEDRTHRRENDGEEVSENHHFPNTVNNTPRSSLGLDKNESNTPAHKLSVALYGILQKHNKVKRFVVKWKSWDFHFRELLKEQTYKEVKELLQWYDQHINDRFCPQCYSAKSFYEKYAYVEKAMQRVKEQEAKEEEQRVW